MTESGQQTQRRSLYWDDFERRAYETVDALRSGSLPPVRRVALFVTERCNLNCAYCNHTRTPQTMTRARFEQALADYGDDAIFHITGGEPSMVTYLYPLLRELGSRYRFHLNTNAVIMPPTESVKRLKVSLDSHDPDEWDALVGRWGAWRRVVDNLKAASTQTVASVTFTMTQQNYKETPAFARFIARELPDLYAVFFSVYKGKDARFALTAGDAERFFARVLPSLEQELNDESLALLRETIDEKMRLMSGTRFPQNAGGPCYLSLSERVISPNGAESTCSHLYRDGIRATDTDKREQCLYGCNRRLCMFNELVAGQLQNEAAA